MFKYVNEVHNVNTRANVSKSLLVAAVRLKVSRNNVSHRGPSYYNALPPHIQMASSKYAFKRNMKNHIC